MIGKQHAKAREHRIGASETSAILGLNPWTTAYDVWLRLTDRLSDSTKSNDAMEMGQFMEGPLLDWAAVKEGVRIRKNVIRVHKSLPMSVQLDAKVIGQRRSMEAKDTMLFKNWGEPGTDQVPDYYQIQAQSHMIVCDDVDEVIVPVCLYDFRRHFERYYVKPNKDLQDLIIERVQAFWRLVQTDTPPEASFPSPDYARRVIRKTGKRVRMPQEAAVWARRYKAYAAVEKRARERKEAAQGLLKGGLVDAVEGAFEMDGEKMLFKASTIHKKTFTVEAHDEMRFSVVKDKQQEDGQ